MDAGRYIVELARQVGRRIAYGIARRPVRVVEALLALLGALGFVIAPELEGQIISLVMALAGIFGGEAAQRHTTSAKYPSLPDGHEDEGHPDYDPGDEDDGT